jgi:hypothetical protein
MKQITMDYETYIKELTEAEISGKCRGLSDVMRYLESGKPFEKFLREDRYFDEEAAYKETVTTPWKRILKALEGTKFN